VIRSAGRQQAAAGQEKPRRGGVLAFAAGGLLVVAAVVAAVLALSHGSGGGSPAATGTSQAAQQGGQNALGPGAAAPGQPVVTARRVSATQVEFSWSYANAAAGDTFRWQELSEGAEAPIHVATKPDALVAVAEGQSSCITVTVRNADGQASLPSTFCSPA
jgi:hypothetical protein